MPIRKFRSAEEMNRARWRTPGSPELYRAIERVWDFGQRTSHIRFPPGVHRYRSVEQMSAAEERWKSEEGKSEEGRVKREE